MLKTEIISIHFYFILLYYILLYSTLFYSILFDSILFYSILFYSILFYSILSYSILFYSIIFYLILSYSILFYSILFYSEREGEGRKRDRCRVSIILHTVHLVNPNSSYGKLLITFYVPVVYKILMRAISKRGPLEGVGPEIKTFFGNERSECHLGPKKFRFQGPPLPMARVMGLPTS